MYLKRLQIQGFKSFALSTTFELTPGVTCVGGPNGAGKTNVADAVRWVLGEQASRVIRARKTEDIIFSGSAKRPPMGMAEVKITLDNADGWLPIDFEEVVVGRRAYRSGDNEYLLNGSRVRLRDIQELFMKAHVGQNSYAFMGQGLVEQVLTLRPEERRGMIEEAADVRLHRDKLDKARSRLKATEENLARVDLLTKELAPRIRALERQANRAAVHEELSTELAKALRALYGQQWQDAQEALAAARATCDQRQEAFERVQSESSNAEEGLTSHDAAVEERRSALASREEALRALDDRRRDLERTITTDEERSVMAAQRRQELLGEIEAQRRERDELLALVDQQASSIAALDEQIAGSIQPATADLEQVDKLLAELRRSLSEAERAAQRAEAEIAGAEGRLRALDDQAALTESVRAVVDESERTLTDARSAIERLVAELGQRPGTEDTLRTQLASIAERLASLHARLEAARTNLKAQNGSETGLHSEIERATAEAARHRGDAERIRAEVDALASERETKAHEVATHSARIDGLEAARDSLRRQHDMQNASLDRAEREIARREEQTHQLAQELETIAARLEATRAALETTSREAEAAREELAPARAALDDMRTRQRAINEEMSAARSRSLAAERSLLEAQSNVRLREEEIEALKERLEEEGFRPADDGDIEPVAGEALAGATAEAGGPPEWLKESSGDGPTPVRGGSQVDTVVLKERIGKLRSQIRNLGPVNEQASTDYEESRERYEFLSGQVEDLRKAEASLQEAITELEGIIKERFSTTFKAVNEKFTHYFQTFFGGGQAELLLTQPDDDGLVGVDIVAQPPRKRVKSLNMLSGGERSLTAVAMLFALLQINPSPIVVLDEVDAALDEANVDRFTQTLRELAERSQFIIITHNRRTLEMADTIYGVSMGEDSTSSVLSLRIGDIAAK